MPAQQQPAPAPKFNFFFLVAMALSAWLLFSLFNRQPEATPPAPPSYAATDDEPSAPAAVGVEADAPPPPLRDFRIRVASRPVNAENDPVAFSRSSATPRRGFSAEFDTRGALMTRYRLLDYFRTPDSRDPDNEVILLDRPARNAPGSLMLESLALSDRVGGQGVAKRLANAQYRLTRVPDGAEYRDGDGRWTADWSGVEGVEAGGDTLEMRASAGGFEIVRRFIFAGSAADARPVDVLFGFRTEVELVNRTGQPQFVSCRLWGPSGLLPDDGGFLGRVELLSAEAGTPGGSDVSLERRDLTSLVSNPQYGEADGRGGLTWIGVKNRFFTAILAADNPAAHAGGAWLAVVPGDRRTWSPPAEVATIFDNVKSMRFADHRPALAAVRLDPMRLEGPVAADDAWKMSFTFYGGPADSNLLPLADPRFERVVTYTFSWFEPISRGLVWFINHLYGWVGNYGLAIILLTLIIKTVLHPLARKMYHNAQAMQRIAPLLNDVKKRYAKDQQKMLLESRRIQQEHKVNMAGGCLPAFVQLPIFLALYGAFSQHFDVRQATFIPGWIEDLSVPDSVWHFSPLPVLGWTELSLLPIIYLVTQIIQMRLQPKSSDPALQQQQKIMQFMPVMFMFFFYAMPSGLVLYFTISSLYGVAENMMLRRLYPPLPPLLPGVEPVPVDDHGKPKAGAGMGAPGGGHGGGERHKK